MTMMRLGLLASHGGSNLQAVLDACADGTISARPAVVITNNSKSRAAERAQQAGVNTVHLSSSTHPDPDELDAAILGALTQNSVDLIALAGYMKRLGPKTISTYRGLIVNIHPGLLPKYGGQGMYGERVHQAVLDSGDTESGATVHLVDEQYDHGSILAQVRVPVLPDDTVDSLAARVLQQEHTLYVRTLKLLAEGLAQGLAQIENRADTSGAK